MKAASVILGLCALTFVADHALAAWAVETNAAAAFLSPAGASLEQLLIAALFLLVRLGGALLLCVTAAWGAGRVASWALSGVATRGTRSGYRNRHPGR